ncbi:MAG: flagellar biosynthesis protein FliQ [Pseudomonadales bacterium]|jgi:flagellar biosynthetic protein FliQ|nr:flagellar biosynthesis protein FliQ [Pseudomonadota bacterium]
MEATQVVELGRDALWLAVLLGAPLLGIALIVGVLIGVIQAATSVNEMTLSFIPKLAALALVLALVGNWQLELLVDFTRGLFEQLPSYFG